MTAGGRSVSDRRHSSCLPFQQTAPRGSSASFLVSSFSDDCVVYAAKIVKICDTTKYFHSNLHLDYSFIHFCD